MASPRLDDAPGVSLPGRHVGPYELLQLLGKGSEGAVYRARDTRSSCFVAVKVGVATETPAFRRELSCLHALGEPGHTGVVKLLDLDAARPPTWFAMEQLDGADLATQRVTQPEAATASEVALRRVLRIVQRMAEALDYIHCRGIVHADLSPKNVRLRGPEEPVICDFGAALRVPRPGDLVERAAWKQSHGTLGYTAPERLVGSPWDSRADLYSLGCIWYELLAQRPVFVADHEHGLVHQHVHLPPVTVSKWVPNFTPTLERLLSSLLAKQPHERPPRAGVVAAEVSARLSGSAAPLGSEVVFLFTPRSGVGASSAPAPLTHPEASQLIQELLGVVPELRLVDHVYAVTRGEPSAVVRYVRWGATAGHIAVTHLAARWKPDEVDDEVPFGLLEAELGPMAPDERIACAAVALAASIGTRSSVVALLRVYSPDAAPELAEGAFTRLSSSGKIVFTESDRFTFEAELDRRSLMSAAPTEVLRALRAFQVQRLSELNDARHAHEMGLLWSALSEPERALGSFRRAARRLGTSIDQRIALVSRATREARTLLQRDRASNDVYSRTAVELLRLYSSAGRHEHVWALSEKLLALDTLSALDRARAHRARGLSFRMVGKYELALENYDLAAAMLARSNGRRLAVQREHVELQMQRARLHYVRGEAEPMTRILRDLLQAHRHIARGEQLADLYMNLANALVSSRRYAFSNQAVRYQRKSCSWHQRRPDAGRESAVTSQFDLAFMLLLGEPHHCVEALALLQQAAATASRFGGTPLSCRIELYRAIAHRRLGDVEACRLAAEHTSSRAQVYGFRGYQGAALGCLAWVEYRKNRPSKAIELSSAATRRWCEPGATQRDRFAEYPFQWLAHLPLLAVYWSQERYEDCGPLLDELRHPAQARLGEPLRGALQAAHHARDQDVALYARALENVVRLARSGGYL